MRASELTDRQRDVARLVAAHYPPKRIAATLGIAHRTVLVHISAIAFRINADPQLDERSQVAAWWWDEHCRPDAA